MGSGRCTLSDGRALAYDDVGDPHGRPVVYLHGNPDARQARHPDDGVASAVGIRLLSVDRPGFGDSDPDPDGGLDALGADLGQLLDELALPSVGILGWSAGGLAALAAAAVLGSRVHSLCVVASMPPVEAYADAALVAALGPARRPFAELALELTAVELAAEVAPYLVPLPLDPELALEHVLEGAGPVGRAELAGVPGAAERLADGLLGAVRHGIVGIEHDLRLQLTPGLDLARVEVPVLLVHGAEDGAAPPSVGRWLAERLPDATLEVVEGGGHHLLFPRWADLLRSLSTASGR